MKIILSLITLSLSCTSYAKETSRPMDEMHGDCTNYSTNLKSEFSIWKSKTENVMTGEIIALNKKSKLLLQEANKVKLAHKPEKEFPAKGPRFAGIFRFVTQEAGHYRVSAGSKTWMDIIDPTTKKPVEAKSFEMQTGCESIFKTVSFQLEKETNYILQISSSKSPSAEFSLTKVNSL